jgi:hypothetical protein
MEKNKGARSQWRPKKGGSSERPPKNATPKLSGLGVSKTQSSRCRTCASGGFESEKDPDHDA